MGALRGGAEDVDAEDLVGGSGEVGRPELPAVRAPLRGREVALGGGGQAEDSLDVVGGFDRRTSRPRCPCTTVEDFGRRIRPRGEGGTTAWRIPGRRGGPGGEIRDAKHFKSGMRI